MVYIRNEYNECFRGPESLIGKTVFIERFVKEKHESRAKAKGKIYDTKSKPIPRKKVKRSTNNTESKKKPEPQKKAKRKTGRKIVEYVPQEDYRVKRFREWDNYSNSVAGEAGPRLERNVQRESEDGAGIMGRPLYRND